LTFDVLADCLRNSVFDPNEVEKERQVIIEELAMTEDSPGDIASILPKTRFSIRNCGSGMGKALFKHADTLPVSIGYAVWTTIAVVVSVPIWHLMGLM